MKKIININLSGRVIPIEDSAYETLQRYIESLRRYFANEEGRDEIINDIESRIAELMNDKVRKGAAAVTDTDIEEIINSMGRVEDFEAVDSEESFTEQTSAGASAGAYTHTKSKRFKGRLYRDANDKMLGGVCAGVANYMNIDPAIIRLLFALVTLGGFGMGVPLYILLWIILPANNLDYYSGKRLFRNPEEKIIGGVAGGLSAYFGKSPTFFRLIFAAPLLLNIFFSFLNGALFPFHHFFFPFNVVFGSLTGTFILAYIILWIVLPEARSPFERMEMRGEKVDVNRIRENVRSEMEQFKTKAQAWGEEVKVSAQQFGERAREFTNTRGREFASEFSQSARPVANSAAHVIGVIFKAFFLFVAGSIAFALFVALIVLVFSGGAAIGPMQEGLFGFVLEGFWQKAFFWGALILFLGTPIIALITWLVRRIMKVRSQKHYLGWVFGGLWTIGFICLILLISSLAKDFRVFERVEQPIAISQPANSRMIVRVDEPELMYTGSLWWMDGDADGFDITEDSLKMANVRVRVVKSEDSNYSVRIFKYSAGENRREAREKAGKVQYSGVFRDSVLALSNGLAIDKESKFRGQRVTVEIKVPVGKKIRFDESVIEKFHTVNIRVMGRKSNRSDEWDWDDNYFDWRTDTDYVMGMDGELIAVDLDNRIERNNSTNNNEGVYEYRRGTPDKSDSLRRSIEEREKQIEEDRRRLEELERTSFAPKASKEEKNIWKRMTTNSFTPLII